jgi:hypothetical protein
VILSAAVLTLQFYLFTEIFADLTAILLLALPLGFGLAGRENRPVVLRLSKLTAVGYLIAIALASPYIVYVLSGKSPKPIAGTAMDLANFVLLKPANLAGITWLTAPVGHPSAADYLPSTAGYVGVPLLILVVLLAASNWRNRLVRVLTCMLVLIMVASLGPVVYVQGRPLVNLPWGSLYNLPIVRNAWMSRLMIFAFLALAVATALWLSRPRSRSAWLRWLLAAVIVANVTIEVFPTQGTQVSAVPAFISKGKYHSWLRPREIVLVVSKIHNAGLLWQAESGYQFRIAGGFFNEGFGAQVRSAHRDLPQALAELAVSRAPATVNAFEAYIKRSNFGAILVDARNKPGWARLFPRMGLVGHTTGNVIIYPIDRCRTCHLWGTRHS